VILSQEVHAYDTHEIASFSVPRSLEHSVLQGMLTELRTDCDVLSVDEFSSTTDRRVFVIVYVWLLVDGGRRSWVAQRRLQAVLDRYA